MAVKKNKRGSRPVEAGTTAASWQQVLQFNTVQNTTASSPPEDKRHLPKDHTAVDGTVQATLHTGQSQSVQDLTKPVEVQTDHHRSTDSLLADRPRTLPRLDQLRHDSRRRSLSGTLFQAYRGLKDSLKAASAELLHGGRDDSHDQLRSQSDKASSNGNILCCHDGLQRQIQRGQNRHKGNVLPHFLPSGGPGADPGIQAVSPQVTFKSSSGGRPLLLSARPVVTFPAEERHHPLTSTKLYCLVTEAHRCERLAQGCYAALSQWEFHY